MDKDLKKLIEALEAAGYVVTRTKRGHVAVHTADGAWVTTFAGTGSDRRGIMNGLAPLKRRGFHWPPRR